MLTYLSNGFILIFKFYKCKFFIVFQFVFDANFSQFIFLFRFKIIIFYPFSEPFYQIPGRCERNFI